MPEKPEYATEEMLEYLDNLRISGETDMYDARSYLIADFPELSRREAGKVLTYWINSFEERHPEEM